MGEGGLNLIEMWNQMTWVGKAVALVLFIMSMWSIGVAMERIYTFSQARKQSKLYAPQVAKHLKDGRLKEAIALSSSKDYRYSHLAKVVLAGLQEYQFQQESGGGLSRDDLVDSVRRSIQRATALTQSDLKKGVNSLATIGPDGRVKDAKVLRSIPLLDQAALDAVKQWQFTPTLLNGVPVPVIMTVTVQFTLQ